MTMTTSMFGLKALYDRHVVQNVATAGMAENAVRTLSYVMPSTCVSTHETTKETDARICQLARRLCARR